MSDLGEMLESCLRSISRADLSECKSTAQDQHNVHATFRSRSGEALQSSESGIANIALHIKVQKPE